MSKAVWLSQVATLQGIEKLRYVVACLRHPTDGCPWDLKQTHQSLKRYMLEEAYEAVEAIDESAHTNNLAAVRDELGDVLLQVMLHSQLAQEAGQFDFEQVCEAISEKLIRRHPHVFASVEAQDAETVVMNWDAIKQAEKASVNEASEKPSVESILKGVSKSQPALSRALETSQRAVKVGFEWPNLDSLWACVMSEYDEFQHEVQSIGPEETPTPDLLERLESEMGDILFATVNLARHFKLDPEVALTKATAKFTRRFQTMERLLQAELESGTPTAMERSTSLLKERMCALSFEQWDSLWNQAKQQVPS